VYILHSDHNTTTLLKVEHQEEGPSGLVMPSRDEYYQVDGSSPVERFAIICSPGEVTDLAPLVDAGTAPYEKWAEIERELRDRSKVKLTQGIEKPLAIAGNVRGGGDEPPAASFEKTLRTFSGRTLLVKGYEFKVEK
jgi:hypothetical protein